ncbi:MAG: RagB/SusD family nutrient uptake outer membrane protein [Rikenellaceae bacterium]
MKKSIILFIAFAIFSSCEGYLDRYPLTSPNSETYLTGEEQVRSYVNGLYESLPSFSTWGIGIWEEESNSDNIVAEEYDTRLNGETQSGDGESNWTNYYIYLRDANYFLDKVNVPEDEMSADVISYIGEAYFFRAYWHFQILEEFGSVPIMDGFWDSIATLEGLQIDQSDRSDVAKFILNDLETAYSMLHPRSKESGLRFNQESALILAMRVALFEGTWEKYHAGSDFASATPDPDYFFGKVIEYGDLLGIGTSDLLYKKDNETDVAESFASMFYATDLSAVEEVTFWRMYSLSSGIYHTVQSYITGGMTVQSTPAGITKSLVDTYLDGDGNFIDPTDAKYKDFNTIFEDRDPRIYQTVMSSGATFKSANEPMLVRALVNPDPSEDQESDPDYDEETDPDADVNPPYIHGSGGYQCATGFHRRIGCDPAFESGSSATAYIYFRTAEALLAYAEAAAELGKADATIMQNTVGALRERAGMPYVTPKADPYFASGGDGYYGYEVDAYIQEIRRERRVELAMQGYRQMDLFRWAAHELFAGKTQKGAYFGEDGVLYQSYTVSQLESIERLGKSADNYLDPQAGVLPNGYGFKTGRDYLMPIPVSEMNLNQKMTQNPGW